MTGVELRSLASEDIAECARLHRAAFPTFFLSALGERFLREFYRAFLVDDAVAWVARASDTGDLLGVVVGHMSPAGFFRRLLIRRWYAFALASLGLVVRQRPAIPRLVRALRYRGQAPVEAGGALLSSICVSPEAQGLRVGRRLIESWTRELESRGVQSAYLTTDARDNAAVNGFYRSAGWHLSASYETPEGRLMNCYTWQRQLDAGETFG